MLIFIFCLLFSLIIVGFFWKYIDLQKQKTLYWFLVFYTFSNVIGAIIFGLADKISYGDTIDFAIDTYLQGEYISSKNEVKYWFLVFSPYIILPILSLNFVKNIKPKWRIILEINKNTFTLSLIFILIVFLAEIYFSNNWGILTLTNLSESKENYTEYILGRTDYFSTLSNRFFGYLYMTLPFFSHISIYKFIKSKFSLFWLLSSILLVGIIILVSLGINQKAPLIIYFISVIIGISLIKKVSYFVFIGAPLVILSIVNIIQIFVQGDDGWDFMLSFFHTLFRAPSAIPYYVNYYPEKFDFVGVDFGILSFLHLPTTDATDNIDIHTVIWGQSFEQFGITGSVAAPFHFRAFAQAGLVFAIFNIFLVALFMRFLTWVYKNKILGEDSVSHAFYTQSLIVLYFLSQTHIRDCLWSSYGIVWIFHGVFISLFFSIIISRKIFTKNLIP